MFSFIHHRTYLVLITCMGVGLVGAARPVHAQGFSFFGQQTENNPSSRDAEVSSRNRSDDALSANQPGLDPLQFQQTYLQPYRTVHVAAAESGLLSEILVREGDMVRRGEALARLDDRDLKVALEIASANATATGELATVTAEESDKRRRLDALRAMHDRGNASNVELLRSQAQHEVAAGRLKTAQEQLALRDLERKRIAVQIDRRTLRSPMDGQVLQQLKQPGEFVSSTDAKVLCLVQLDVLQARFALPTSDLHAVRAGRTVDLLIGQQQLPARGIVEFVSPVVDAETGTVLVKVRIENAEGKYVSGSVVSFAATANRVTTKRQAISRDSATGGRQRTPSRNTVSQR